MHHLLDCFIYRSYAVALGRGGVEGRKPSTNRLSPARGGRTVGVAPGRLAAAGRNRGMRGDEASPHPSTTYVLLLIVPREGEAHRGALARGALGPDAPAVGLDDAPGNGETQACAAAGARP